MSGRRPRSRVEAAAAVVFILLLAFTAGVVCAASAQSLDPGRLTGRVTDATGYALPGVQLALMANGVVRPVGTSQEGSFAFEEVTPNIAYTIQAELMEFRTATVAGLVLAPGQ